LGEKILKPFLLSFYCFHWIPLRPQNFIVKVLCESAVVILLIIENFPRHVDIFTLKIPSQKLTGSQSPSNQSKSSNLVMRASLLLLISICVVDSFAPPTRVNGGRIGVHNSVSSPLKESLIDIPDTLDENDLWSLKQRAQDFYETNKRPWGVLHCKYWR
jgi:hypothetical protein